MNVSKKYDRLRQWGREKMGADVKTTNTDEFKNLEQEMDNRYDGMDKLHSSMNSYVKYISKRSEGDSRDKNTPTSHLGAAMTHHGDDFEEGSKFGECLTKFGETQERIARVQDTYAIAAKSSWLDACARSIAMMKDYQNARKKLEARRLAYDSCLGKMQKSKKDDYKTEEELRAQKAKYEESVEDVTRRMQDIIDSEADSMSDLQTFLDAQLNYHDRCREVLLQLKRDWPAGDTTSPTDPRNNGTRSRTNTNTSSGMSMASSLDYDSPLPEPNPPFRPSPATSSNPSPQKEYTSFSFSNPRCSSPDRYQSSSAIYTPQTSSRSASPATTNRSRNDSNASSQNGRMPTPLASIGAIGGVVTPTPLATVATATPPTPSSIATKKAPPPPPPPSRATKPKPPPPPPMRNAMSTTSVPSAVC